MALSGRFDFNLTVDEIIRIATQSVGGGPLDGESLKQYAILLNFVQRDLLNRGIPLALICYLTVPTIVGEQTYDLPLCVIDIHDCVLETISTEIETPMHRVSYAEFNHIGNKTTSGRPSTYVGERLYDKVMMRVWPLPDKVYNMNMYVFIKPDDVYKYTDNIRIQPRYLPAVTACLAYEIGKQRNLPLDRLQLLKQDYEQKVAYAQEEDRERVSFRITPELNRY